MSWRALVLRLMRVPHQPEPPPGSPPTVFRASRNYLTLLIVQWMIKQALLLLIPITFMVMVAVVRQAKGPQPSFVSVMETLAWIIFFTQFALSWALLRLHYELRWYMLSDRAIRIREGIATVREKTMALANVQNIAVRQGPLQRLLGIADVEVKTAGGGAASAGPHGRRKSMAEPMHVAFFRGVDNAEEIRDLVREGVRRQRDAGLGDPDERAHDPAPHAAAAAAVELLREARKLRAVVEATR